MKYEFQNERSRHATRAGTALPITSGREVVFSRGKSALGFGLAAAGQVVIRPTAPLEIQVVVGFIAVDGSAETVFDGVGDSELHGQERARPGAAAIWGPSGRSLICTELSPVQWFPVKGPDFWVTNSLARCFSGNDVIRCPGWNQMSQ